MYEEMHVPIILQDSVTKDQIVRKGTQNMNSQMNTQGLAESLFIAW